MPCRAGFLVELRASLVAEAGVGGSRGLLGALLLAVVCRGGVDGGLVDGGSVNVRARREETPP
jgi:hypothetical protein